MWALEKWSRSWLMLIVLLGHIVFARVKPQAHDAVDLLDCLCLLRGGLKGFDVEADMAIVGKCYGVEGLKGVSFIDRVDRCHSLALGLARQQ